MFDISWTEILVIGAVALIFIGPKELPGALRTIGRFVSKARGMAREFQSNVEEMVRESELDDLRKQVSSAATGDFTREIEKQIDPKGDIAAAFAPPELPSLDSPAPSPAPGAGPPAPLPAPAPEPAPSPSAAPNEEPAPTPRPPT
jgi:sec-independent protein translocase protein TatB